MRMELEGGKQLSVKSAPIGVSPTGQNDMGVFHLLNPRPPLPELVEGRGGCGFDKLSLPLLHLKQMKHTQMIWVNNNQKRLGTCAN